MGIVIDNITLIKRILAPNALINANGMPFEYRGVLFYPKYANGIPYRYDGQFKSIRLSWHKDKIYLQNSIHKYSKGNNFSDFHLTEMREAISELCESTGIDWNDAEVKTLEYGCNIQANSSLIYQTLLSYKGKNYLPMHKGGKVYGAESCLTDYKLKGYDKALQVSLSEHYNLPYSLFRWEIALNRIRGLEKAIQITPLRLHHLSRREVWQFLADDAISKYQTSIKMQALNLHKIDNIEKLKKIAVMLLPKFRDHIRTHKKDSYKNYNRIFKQILADKSICEASEVESEMMSKFDQLINGDPTF